MRKLVVLSGTVFHFYSNFLILSVARGFSYRCFGSRVQRPVEAWPHAKNRHRFGFALSLVKEKDDPLSLGTVLIGGL